MEGSALQLGAAYAVAENWQQFDESFDSWYNNDGPSLLEIKTKGIEAAGFYNALKICLNVKWLRFTKPESEEYDAKKLGDN